jgi:hypothetical protein
MAIDRYYEIKQRTLKAQGEESANIQSVSYQEL